MSVRLAPLANSFFRPEEKHIASGEDNIVPPLRRRHQAVEQPGGSSRSIKIYLEMKRLTGLFAAGVNFTG
jgi:hypothetical protein